MLVVRYVAWVFRVAFAELGDRHLGGPVAITQDPRFGFELTGEKGRRCVGVVTELIVSAKE